MGSMPLYIRAFGILICALRIRQPATELKMAARHDFHWLRFLQIIMYHTDSFGQSCLKTFSIFIYNVSPNTGCRLQRQSCDPLRVLLLLVLIVTCAVRSLRAHIYKHIGSKGIQNCVEFPFPVSQRLFFLRLFSPLGASAFLIPSLSHGHAPRTLCMAVLPCVVLCV